MNRTKIEELKAVADAAAAAHDAEQSRLVAAGLKSAERYKLLKPLQTARDDAHAVYAKYAKGQINRELVKIINADRPIKEAAARARSAWKMAKFQNAAR